MFSPRRALYFLFVFLYLVLSECQGEGYKPAPNCARYECPSYSVVHSEKDFEIRSYQDALWLSGPKISSKSYKEAADKGFLILFGYYHGNNLQKVKINMTTPVLVDVQNSAYTVYFYVPQKYQKGTPLPQPTSNLIKQVKLPRHKYAAVRRFDGFITDANIPTQIAALKKSLQGTPYQRAAALDLSTVAGYNSPFEPINRVNEVFLWFD
ncbi:hypothetical protein Pfo_003856 [Paulownia fortunei]|nr:hypothetical protein Pfo_003856 [Paulownia fortunei]